MNLCFSLDFNSPYRDVCYFLSVIQFHFHRIRSTFKRSKKAAGTSTFKYLWSVSLVPKALFQKTTSFLRREDQRMLVLSQPFVSVGMRSILPGISINLIGGQLETSQNSMDSTENSFQIDNNLIFIMHS